MPMLAIPFPDIDPIAVRLGPLAIKWYGLAYMAGLLLGWLYVKRLLGRAELWRDGKPPFAPHVADDLFIWVALGVIVGGRLGHVLLYEPGLYLRNPIEILQIWKGGMAFHGGLAGTIVAMWLFARQQGFEALTVMDLVSAAVPFGLFFGRIANFINAEVLGRVSEVPWAMVFPNAGPLPRHPAQLYEAALEGAVLFALLAWLIHSKLLLRQPGFVGAAFLLGYGSFRTFCELFKVDDYGGVFSTYPFTNGMVYSLLMVIAGLAAFRYLRRQPEAS